MAGTDESDEDLVSGRVNRANDWTRIWAERLDKDSDFGGDCIFRAEVSPEPNNIDDWENDCWLPKHLVDGIVGVGFSGVGSAAVPGGVGVTGLGGLIQGTGVFGRGAGAAARGVGGFGVHGLGGNGGLQDDGTTIDPGVGVVGQGGTGTFPGQGPGPGVVGVGGGRALPPGLDVADVGVFGAGATGMVGVAGGVVSPTTATRAGVGVCGAGTTGVVGVAAGAALLPASARAGVGVFGTGTTGVVGLAGGGALPPAGLTPGAAVMGFSTGDRGAVFGSDRAAQLRLVPQQQKTEFPKLPKNGRVGDLILIRNTGPNQDGVLIDRCSLWLCIPKDPSKDASDQWQGVVLGPTVTGTV
jgi:hypothetical protein